MHKSHGCSNTKLKTSILSNCNENKVPLSVANRYCIVYPQIYAFKETIVMSTLSYYFKNVKIQQKKVEIHHETLQKTIDINQVKFEK